MGKEYKPYKREINGHCALSGMYAIQRNFGNPITSETLGALLKKDHDKITRSSGFDVRYGWTSAEEMPRHTILTHMFPRVVEMGKEALELKKLHPQDIGILVMQGSTLDDDFGRYVRDILGLENAALIQISAACSTAGRKWEMLQKLQKKGFNGKNVLDLNVDYLQPYSEQKDWVVFSVGGYAGAYTLGTDVNVLETVSLEYPQLSHLLEVYKNYSVPNGAPDAIMRDEMYVDDKGRLFWRSVANFKNPKDHVFINMDGPNVGRFAIKGLKLHGDKEHPAASNAFIRLYERYKQTHPDFHPNEIVEIDIHHANGRFVRHVINQIGDYFRNLGINYKPQINWYSDMGNTGGASADMAMARSGISVPSGVGMRIRPGLHAVVVFGAGMIAKAVLLNVK